MLLGGALSSVLKPQVRLWRMFLAEALNSHCFLEEVEVLPQAAGSLQPHSERMSRPGLWVPEPQTRIPQMSLTLSKIERSLQGLAESALVKAAP